ncbi:DUF899 family protein [Fulvimonas yonginensis]|uniref:DUF899 family protein n=1 Tax=Fulvimonas yonginensis TaxID=1495200 RepID=UPI003CE4B2F6
MFLHEGGTVYRSDFTRARRVDRLRLDFNLLDLTPCGRQERWEDSPPGLPQGEPYRWWRRHDEYAPLDLRAVGARLLAMLPALPCLDGTASRAGSLLPRRPWGRASGVRPAQSARMRRSPRTRPAS